MSTRRQLAGLTLGTAAAVSLGAVAMAQPAPPAPPDPTLTPSPPPTGSPTGSPEPTASPAPPPPPQGQPGTMTLVARRTELTLPSLPTMGVPYVCLLDVFDEAAQQVGTATAGSMVVGVTLEGPVVLGLVVLHLADGEIHYQRIINRFGAFPRTSNGAILGGTGAYSGARGDVGISWPNDDQVDLLVNLAA